MAASDETCTQWWFHECPFPENCTNDAWNRKWHRRQSWISEEDARFKFCRHLQSRDEHKQGLANLDNERVKALVDTQSIESRTINKQDDEHI
eukprot:5691916-Pyramimonas_sp.AAC.1